MMRGLLVILAVLFPALVASGQSINRRAVAITSMPTGPNSEIEEYLIYAIDGSPTSTTDASTIVELIYLDEVTASDQADITLDPVAGCTPGSVCGQATYNGVPFDRMCAKDQRCVGGSCATECQLLITAFVPPRVQGVSGYFIRLRPAVGAAPDANANDDTIILPLEVPVAWDRSVRSLRSNDLNHDGIIESLTITWRFGTKNVPAVAGVTSLDYSARVQIESQSTIVSSAIGLAQFTPNPSDPCTRACPAAVCGTTNQGSAITTCTPTPAIGSCACGADIATIVPSPLVAFTPGQVVTIRLVPAPGAVPEPEFLVSNDSVTFAVPSPCPGDANGDYVCNGADLSLLLGQFGQQVIPYSGADYNGDGVVNNADLSLLLGNFGDDCVP